MPLSGGTSGAHDDSMHQGSAKRDVAEGLAGLDVGGHVLAPGYRFTAARGAAEQITIRERTSDERVVRFIRIGADDYEARVNVGGVEKVVQHAGFKDVVNGLAALDAAGALLVPGSKIYYTRDGSNDVHIYERTSNEEAYAFHRVGADDYTFFVKESNVWKQMQTESMKDVVNGIAALDASGDLLVPGSELHLTRTGTGWVFVKERTSGEVVFQFRRMGADDYVPSVVNSGAPSPIQLANMKDVASGIAGLDADAKIADSSIAGLFKKYLIGDASLHTYTGHVSTDTGSFVLLKTITLNTLNRTPSTIRVKFDLYRTGFLNDVKGRIYKNGAPFGTERVTSSDSAITYSEDLSFAQGDTLELWLFGYGCSTPANNDEFYICGTEPQLTIQQAIDDADVGALDPLVATNS